ncbi:MAG: hypothetical protein LBL79_02260 [Prevotella sp.]|jgi:hypothetical protein|nr:hypothetical protein [Prevotella sp.]
MKALILQCTGIVLLYIKKYPENRIVGIIDTGIILPAKKEISIAMTIRINISMQIKREIFVKTSSGRLVAAFVRLCPPDYISRASIFAQTKRKDFKRSIPKFATRTKTEFTFWKRGILSEEHYIKFGRFPKCSFLTG